MSTKIKENVIYETFDDKSEFQQHILSMIVNSKTSKILYKGNPHDIEYKTMRKVMLGDISLKVDPDTIKSDYKNIVEQNGKKNYCVIYKL